MQIQCTIICDVPFGDYKYMAIRAFGLPVYFYRTDAPEMKYSETTHPIKKALRYYDLEDIQAELESMLPEKSHLGEFELTRLHRGFDSFHCHSVDVYTSSTYKMRCLLPTKPSFESWLFVSNLVSGGVSGWMCNDLKTPTKDSKLVDCEVNLPNIAYWAEWLEHNSNLKIDESFVMRRSMTKSNMDKMYIFASVLSTRSPYHIAVLNLVKPYQITPSQERLNLIDAMKNGLGDRVQDYCSKREDIVGNGMQGSVHNIEIDGHKLVVKRGMITYNEIYLSRILSMLVMDGVCLSFPLFVCAGGCYNTQKYVDNIFSEDYNINDAFLVMERLDHELEETHEMVPEVESGKQVLFQMMYALYCMSYYTGRKHYDIKVGNVMTKDGYPVIIDFGYNGYNYSAPYFIDMLHLWGANFASDMYALFSSQNNNPAVWEIYFRLLEKNNFQLVEFAKYYQTNIKNIISFRRAAINKLQPTTMMGKMLELIDDVTLMDNQITNNDKAYFESIEHKDFNIINTQRTDTVTNDNCMKFIKHVQINYPTIKWRLQENTHIWIYANFRRCSEMVDAIINKPKNNNNPLTYDINHAHADKIPRYLLQDADTVYQKYIADHPILNYSTVDYDNMVSEDEKTYHQNYLDLIHFIENLLNQSNDLPVCGGKKMTINLAQTLVSIARYSITTYNSIFRKNKYSSQHFFSHISAGDIPFNVQLYMLEMTGTNYPTKEDVEKLFDCEAIAEPLAVILNAPDLIVVEPNAAIFNDPEPIVVEPNAAIFNDPDPIVVEFNIPKPNISRPIIIKPAAKAIEPTIITLTNPVPLNTDITVGFYYLKNDENAKNAATAMQNNIELGFGAIVPKILQKSKNAQYSDLLEKGQDKTDLLEKAKEIFNFKPATDDTANITGDTLAFWFVSNSNQPINTKVSEYNVIVNVRTDTQSNWQYYSGYGVRDTLKDLGVDGFEPKEKINYWCKNDSKTNKVISNCFEQARNNNVMTSMTKSIDTVLKIGGKISKMTKVMAALVTASFLGLGICYLKMGTPQCMNFLMASAAVILDKLYLGNVAGIANNFLWDKLLLPAKSLAQKVIPSVFVSTGHLDL